MSEEKKYVVIATIIHFVGIHYLANQTTNFLILQKKIMRILLPW